MNRQSLIREVGDALSGEWPHLFNDGFQYEVAEAAIDIIEELDA